MKLKQVKIFISVFTLLLLSGFSLQAQSESAFLHTDQPYYLSGQSIQYTAYLAPYKGSTVLHVSLWNEEEEEVLIDQRVEIKEGVAYGKLALSSELPTGKYLLAANTNQMLGQAGNKFGKKTFYIFNPGSPQLVTETDELSASFFPEGGQLIAGRSNKIAFRFSDRSSDLEGAIINQNNEVVSRFKTQQLGYGITNLLAKTGDSYSAVVTRNGQDYRFPIGSAITDKASIRLVRVGSDTLNVIVNIGDDLTDRQLTLQAYHNQELILGAPQLVSKPAIQFTLPKNLLGQGLNRLVIVNDQEEVISERLVYHNGLKTLGGSVKAQDAVLKPRTKESIPLSLDKDLSKAKVSVAIRSTEYFPDQSIVRADHQLQLFSQLSSSGPEPGLSAALDDVRFMDLYLISQRMADAKSEGATQYYAGDGQRLIPISGKVSIFDKPIGDSTLYLSILSEKPQFHTAKLDRNGNFNLLVYPFEGEADIILKLAQVNEKMDNVKYEIFSAIPQVTADDFGPAYMPSTEELNKHLKLMGDNEMMARNYYPETPAAQMEKTELGSFFFNYNFEIDYTEYITLNSFTEIKRELIEQISIGRRTGELRVKQHDEQRDWYIEPYDKAPLMLIDGLPVFEEKKVLELNPAQIKDIRIMNRQYLVGGVIFDGVIELTTTHGEYYLREKTNHALLKLPGYSSMEGESAAASEVLESGTLPDFRSVLHWSPSLNTSSGNELNISFTTSDDIGTFLMEILGIDEKGNPIHIQKLIQVK